MSPPRRPFGADQPGRLQATMMKVLAAEMSDPGRLARGKRLRVEDAVVDLVVGHGAATAVVQGSRPDPYVVTLLTRPGRSVPSRREVTVRCTCPDDDAVGSDACKHAVAALFALADEVSLDTAVLARWRQSDTFDDDDGDHDDHEDHDDEGDSADDRHGTRAAPKRAREPAPAPPVDPLVAELAELLRPPAGARLPEVPELTALDPTDVADRLVADVLADAVAHLRVRWE